MGLMHRVKAGVLLAAVVGLTSGQAGAGLGARVVGTHDGREVTAVLPFSAGTIIEQVILQAAATARVPIGIERVVDEPVPPGIVPVKRNRQRVTLTGRSLADVLDLGVAQAQQLAGQREQHLLAWKVDDGVIHVRPFAGSKPSFLDTIVPSFELKDATLLQALSAVHRLIDLARPEPPSTGPSARSIIGSGPVSGNVVGPPIESARVSVVRKAASIRDVLDAIVLASGGHSWVVRYRDASCGYAGSVLILAGFDGKSMASPASRDVR